MVLLGPDWEKAKTQAEVGRFSDRFKGSNIPERSVWIIYLS